MKCEKEKRPERWHAVNIEIPVEAADIASHFFHEASCNGIIEELRADAGKRGLTAYFSAENETAPALEKRLHLLFDSSPSLSQTVMVMNTVGNKDWQKNWQQWFSPFEIVPGIVVAPSWEEYKPRQREKTITLDPGMAFGTGLHETTRLCAKALHALLSSAQVNSLLDVGTGSGLLAMIGHHLGIARIVALDNDPDALGVARENFRPNGCADIETESDLSVVTGTYDIIVANILLSTLLDLRDVIVPKLSASGTLVLSGITLDQRESLSQAYAKFLVPKKELQDGEWAALIFRRE